MSAAAANPGPDLAARLRSVRVSLRRDLEVTRHLFRGQPSYVVRDPLTFQTHRFEVEDYEVLVRIDARHTLGEVFDQVVAAGLAPRDAAEDYYQFIVILHRLGFLSLPVSDERLLLRRAEARRRVERRSLWLSPMFVRIPLCNPDAFLARTVAYVSFLFTRWFFAAWLALALAAGYVAAVNWRDLAEPFQGALAASNLPLMWVTLIALKLFHELGHAYACKRFGGHVPETGVFLVLLTPCAYVDATASWGFTSKAQRIIVCLAGMYVESIFAAAAVFVWAATGPGLLHSIAFNVIFLASVVTILFNVNPLMKFDGYYVLSDLLELPNLRQRATQYAVGALKRCFLGLRGQVESLDAATRAFLLAFGLAVGAYKLLVLTGIAAILAAKLSLIGLLLGGGYVVGVAFGIIRRVLAYLWFARETQPVRARAVALSAVGTAGLAAVLLLLPVGASVSASGVVCAENERVLRAATPGFLAEVVARAGQPVRRGEALLRLDSPALVEQLADARARLAQSETRAAALDAGDPGRAAAERERAAAHRIEAGRREREREALEVRADLDGALEDALGPTDVGRFVAVGAPLATVAGGRWRVQASLSEMQVAAAQPRIGQAVEFRTGDARRGTLPGVIVRVEPAARRGSGPAGTHAAAIGAPAGQSGPAHFEVTIELPGRTAGVELRSGQTGCVRFAAQRESLGVLIYRGVLTLVRRAEKG